MFNVVTVGEALVEIMRPDRDRPLDETGLFSGPFASGAPAIVAAAASRLGMSAGFISGVGDDAFGRMLRSSLEAEGVDTTYLQTVSGYTTGMAFVGYTSSGSREFVFHLRHSASAVIDANYLAADYFSRAQWLHLSGSSLALSEGVSSACSKALDLTMAAGGRLSLDPNLRQELMPLAEAQEALAPYLAVASLILPTAEEALVLTNAVDDSDAAQILLGDEDRIVVLKRGAEGCTVFTQSNRVDVAGFAVEEIDPTGAGDCFNAAFLLGLNSGWELERAALFANAAGALAVTKQGPMEGAPVRQEIELLLKKESG